MEEQENLEIDIGDLRHAYEKMQEALNDLKDVDGLDEEDTGTESFTEKEKGLASDSFKRACFNWGIGRELYTAPFIWIKAEDTNVKETTAKGKYACYDKFTVEAIQITNKEITGLAIKNNQGKRVFVYKK